METHIRCLTKACNQLGIGYNFLDKEENFIQLDKANELIFQRNRTPFNTEVMASICKDKEHTYHLLNQQIAMPKTVGYLDFNTSDEYQKYIRYKTLDAVLENIEKEFTYPVVIKSNSGALGINVFLCHDQERVREALSQIFNRNSSFYDYVALAQEYIPSEKEFRMVYFKKELVLCYQRVSENKEFGAKYWDSNKGFAIHFTDSKELSSLTEFLSPVLELPGLSYVGCDVIKSHQGKNYLIEINSGPKYNHFVDSCGEKEVIKMYTKILREVYPQLSQSV